MQILAGRFLNEDEVERIEGDEPVDSSDEDEDSGRESGFSSDTTMDSESEGEELGDGEEVVDIWENMVREVGGMGEGGNMGGAGEGEQADIGAMGEEEQLRESDEGMR